MPGRLYAIADLHLSFPLNRDELAKLPHYPQDSLILAGDLGEKPEHLSLAFELCTQRFAQVLWVPGNHELYSVSPTPGDVALKGERKYQQCVQIARQHGVLTPEDDWLVWEGEGEPVLICLLFTLYDYSFAPAPHNRSMEAALEWAKEVGTEATDEALLFADPYEDKAEWGAIRLEESKKRLVEARKRFPDLPFVIVNHWPLRRDVIFIPLAPRFEIWCGSTATENWHKEFGAKVVVTGHLHVRRTDWRDGCRFEEVSLGYPRQWEDVREMGKGVQGLLREIWPGEAERNGQVPTGEAETKWRRYG